MDQVLTHYQTDGVFQFQNLAKSSNCFNMSLDYGITMTTNPRWESQPTAK